MLLFFQVNPVYPDNVENTLCVQETQEDTLTDSLVAQKMKAYLSTAFKPPSAPNVNLSET